MSSESYWIERAGELSAALAEAQRERDEALDEVNALAIDLAEERTEAQRREELMRPVVEAARSVRRAGYPMPDDLAAAVDTYETQEGTE